MTDQRGNLLARLKKWWVGEYVMYENPPNTAVVFIGGFQVRPRLAVVIEAVLRWLGKNYWQLIGVILTGIGLLIAYIKL
jgi:hypothetical protein